MLDLQDNNLNDQDALLIADALKGNNTLQELHLDGNQIGQSGEDALWNSLLDTTTLNAVVNTNHTCRVNLSAVQPRFADLWDVNQDSDPNINGRRKLYHALAMRHRGCPGIKRMSTTEHYFGSMIYKHLPNILAMIQSAHSPNHIYWTEGVKPLSIVYEVLRKWEESLSLYETLGCACK